MLKKLAKILTYYDSEPTEVLQGLIWFIFAPMVIMAAYPAFWYISICSIFIGFSSLYSVVYLDLTHRKYVGFAYSLLAILTTTIFFKDHGFNSDPMNWGWFVITISAISNVRRIIQKQESRNNVASKIEIDKMYREDLEKKIESQSAEIFNLRTENIKLKNPIKK